MITLYLAIALINGKVEPSKTLGVYESPAQCYSVINFPDDEGSDVKYECMKMQGNVIQLEVVEK